MKNFNSNTVNKSANNATMPSAAEIEKGSQSSCNLNKSIEEYENWMKDRIKHYRYMWEKNYGNEQTLFEGKMIAIQFALMEFHRVFKLKA